ncbi:MAG TPA: DUF4174 domain-containing protein [Rhodothermales bacterium]|nr:DUF4174 domain-containing protein [Rhodothermales bacterium]
MRQINSLYIEGYRGKNRLLLLFAPSAKGASFEAQMNLLDGEGEELDRRDIVHGTIFVEGTSRLGERALDRAAVLGLREDFGINPESFCMVLVDKDGTELLRDDAAMEPDVIYGYFDQPAAERVDHRQNTRVQSR